MMSHRAPALELKQLAARCSDALRTRYGGRLQSGGELRARCPAHHGQHQRTFSFNSTMGCWHCFKCNAGGNIGELARLLDCHTAAKRNNFRKHIAATLAAIDAQPWPGKAGATDREILRALVQIASRVATFELTCSERQLAELTGVTRATAHRALRRLEQHRWLQRQELGHSRQASTWRIYPPRRVCTELIPLTPSGSEYSNGFIVVQSHDALRWGALGKNARLVLQCLATPVSIAEIARRTRLHRNTISALVRKAARHGLVVSERGGWILAGGWTANLDAIAEASGTRGTGERVRDQHENERLAYRRLSGSKNGRVALRVIEAAWDAAPPHWQGRSNPKDSRVLQSDAGTAETKLGT